MPGRVDADIEKILPLLPLKDAASLTPRRAREELKALAESRKDLPLPQPASVADLMIAGSAGPIAARVYRPGKMPAATVVFFHGGGWVAGDIDTHDRNARTLAIELEAVVLSVDYRRPPETPFPGTFDDCLAATRWAAQNIADLGGDGRAAGGCRRQRRRQSRRRSCASVQGPWAAAGRPVPDLPGNGPCRWLRVADRERQISIPRAECRGVFPHLRGYALVRRSICAEVGRCVGPPRLADAGPRFQGIAASRHLHG